MNLKNSNATIKIPKLLKDNLKNPVALDQNKPVKAIKVK